MKEVIKGLEMSYKYSNVDEDNTLVPQEIVLHAIELLKAQESIAPVKVNRYMETDENGNWFSPETYDCGNCGVELHDKANYCYLCGRAVKWE